MRKQDLEKILLDGKAKQPLWIVCNDNKFYKTCNSNIIKFPKTTLEVLEHLKNNKNIFLSPYEPDEKIKDFFVIKYLIDGLQTTQEKYYNISEAETLTKKLGIKVVESNYSLKDWGGGFYLRDWIDSFLKAEEKGYKSKGIFLVGVPGTGKTFFPQCLAGELNRPLVSLNLAMIKEKENPIESLNRIFEYLSTTGTKQILLLDEVEKMVGKADDPLTGRLMSVLSDLGSEASEFKGLDILLFATANNLTEILDNQPAFLRRGRFDELFFMNFPTPESAINIYQLYIKKYNLEVINNLFDLQDLIIKIDNEYKESKTQINRHTYTPSEIQTFVKRLNFIRMTKGSISKEDIEDNIKAIIPLIKTSIKGVTEITAQKYLFIEI